MMENNLPINVTMKNNGITLKLDYNPNDAELCELLTSINSPNGTTIPTTNGLKKDLDQFGFTEYEQEQLLNIITYHMLDSNSNVILLSEDYYPLRKELKTNIIKKFSTARTPNELPSDFECRLLLGKVKTSLTLNEWKNIKDPEEKYAYKRYDLPTMENREPIFNFLINLLCNYKHTII
jgi:hypothetical protein